MQGDTLSETGWSRPHDGNPLPGRRLDGSLGFFASLDDGSALLVAAEGVTDGSSGAEDVVRVKFEIVRDEVVMRFRAEKDVLETTFVEWRVVEPESEVHQEVIAVDVGTATATVATTNLPVKEQTLATGPSHEISAEFGSEAGSVDPIDVVEDRAEVLRSVIEALFGAEGALDVQPTMILGQILQAEASVHASAVGRRHVGQGSGIGLRRLENAATTS